MGLGDVKFFPIYMVCSKVVLGVLLNYLIFNIEHRIGNDIKAY